MPNKPLSTVKLTVTLPDYIFEEIEKNRGDISRSRYVFRLLEKGLERTKK